MQSSALLPARARAALAAQPVSRLHRITRKIREIFVGDVGSSGAFDYSHSLFGLWPTFVPGTRIDYRLQAGDPMENSIVVACLNWIARTFPEARQRVILDDGIERRAIPNHTAIQIIRKPNEYYNGLLLWQATMISWNVDGNAYWIKLRDTDGLVKELWYEPHFTIRPVYPSDGTEFISGYQLLRGGKWQDRIIDRRDVIHFRNGLDPRNPRLGLSPLRSALREIFTDNEAAGFSASLLRNLGIPGVVISPAAPDIVIDDPEKLKNDMMSKYGGDRRGEPLVMTGPTKVDVLSFSPEQMDLAQLRNIPEERISSLLGIHPMVVGLGAGLRRSSFTNYQTAKASAYEGNIIPSQVLLSAQLDSDYLSEFGDNSQWYFDFDISRVRALSAYQSEVSTRAVQLWRGGLLKRYEARAHLDMGFESDLQTDNVYFTDLPVIQERIVESDTSGSLFTIQEQELLGVNPDGTPKTAPNAEDAGGDVEE